jgi:hypothetical protein
MQGKNCIGDILNLFVVLKKSIRTAAVQKQTKSTKFIYSTKHNVGKFLALQAGAQSLKK